MTCPSQTTQPQPDWQPQDRQIQADQRAAYDSMREHCPVAFSDSLQWSVFKHSDVKRILLDHQSFSNHVSKHVSVPNGMDLPEHQAFFQVIEPYFSAERVAAFKPICQQLADELANQVFTQPQVEIMASFAEPFSARLQCAFMGWPLDLAPVLLNWIKRNNQAVLAGDRPLLGELAREFEALIREQLDARRQDPSKQDVTAQLLAERVNGQPLTDEQIASILRNWTVGEVGTMAAAIGIICQFLATHPTLQQQLREQPELLWQANDEILRLHNPLTDNRRRTTCPVQLGGRSIPANERITINWVAANRDPDAFERADEFMLERDQSQNLLYGAGLHVCPGEGLARMELVAVIRCILSYCPNLSLALNSPPSNAQYPMSGYASLTCTTN